MTEAAGAEELNLQEAAELFRLIYPAFAALLDKAEAARGPLKEFHLAMAAEHAKSGVRILGWDSRRAINAIFELYKERYLAEGRIAADLWAADCFGCDLEAAIVESEDVRELEERIKAVVLQIRQREADLQRLRRELGQLEELRAELSRPVILNGSVTGGASANPEIADSAAAEASSADGSTPLERTRPDVAVAGEHRSREETYALSDRFERGPAMDAALRTERERVPAAAAPERDGRQAAAKAGEAVT